ncbi:uncharacterized protein LOC124457281 [Xenia sp. Carnegie-2017]|uniref:uncharacterized protein LOC124457281 n=1 Tax=Xenia sp. Carnegie-2017 TaxID=2897299 RepID=UPI001F03CE98|nr:uncharacterized protein LOC124457281 [Xenia sp. Carnegie-2017]
MVHFCAFFACSNRCNREKNRRFFHLPAVKSNVNVNKKQLQLERQKEWLRRIRREDLTPEKFANAHRNTERSSRYQGIIEKKRRSETANALIAMSSEQPNEVVDKMDTSEPKANEMSSQTDKTVNELRLLEDEVDFLRKENSDLKKKLLQKELNEVAFKDDDEKIPAFTKGKKQISGIEVEQTRKIANRQ